MDQRERDDEGTVIWGIIGVMVLALCFYFTWRIAQLDAVETLNADKRTSQYVKDTDRQIDETCTVADLASMKDCVIKAIKASEENQRATQDLDAQRQVARWTFWMLVFSFFGTASTVVGIIFLKLNLSEMQLQRRLLKSSVDIAADADRPHMVLADLKLSGIRSPPEPDGFVNVMLDYKFKNYGRSPALLKKTNMVISFQKELPDPPAYSDGDTLRFTVSVDAWYGTTRPLAVKINAKEICEFLLGEVDVFFFGYLDYTGANGRKYRERYAYQLLFDDGDASERFYPDGPDCYWDQTPVVQ